MNKKTLSKNLFSAVLLASLSCLSLNATADWAKSLNCNSMSGDWHGKTYYTSKDGSEQMNADTTLHVSYINDHKDLQGVLETYNFSCASGTTCHYDNTTVVKIKCDGSHIQLIDGSDAATGTIANGAMDIAYIDSYYRAEIKLHR